MNRALSVVGFSILVSLAAAAQTRPVTRQESGPPQSVAPHTLQDAESAVSPQSPPEQAAPAAEPSPASSPEAQPEVSEYNKVIFQHPIPDDQLAFIKRFDGSTVGELVHEKQFRKLTKNVIPDCMFHYGRDMPLLDAMDITLNNSPEPVHIRDGRYVMVAGQRGPYLAGQGFLWIDLQDGIVLGAFYFHPTNGEPTPAVNVFSRQVKEEFLALSELPPAFAEDLNQWSASLRIPLITARYFINGSNRKILLEHDEDFCLLPDGARAPSGGECQRVNADAADLDMDAANYLEQTHHVTNATAWMITGEDQRAWLRVRITTCGDLLPCRIRMTRERIGVIIRRPPRVHVHAVPPVRAGKR